LTGHASRLAVSVCALVASAAALVVIPLASARPTPRFNPPKAYYLALGDSVAYGFQVSKFVAGLQPSEFDTGYVDVVATRLRAIRPDLRVVNYGCPGETTTSFLAGPCLYTTLGEALHDSFEGSQLSAAVTFLRAHRGQVSPITLTLWGGDIREFIASCGGDFSCIQANAPAEIERIASRLSTILGELRTAAPDAEVIITGPWNTNVGFFPETDPLFQALNAAMARATADNSARFADAFPVFNPQGNLGAETPAICTLTLLCSAGDSHPSDAGYRAIADIVFETSGYARLGD
jgi:lysophospholipase L1-like esterase